jgi:hypothetical protein
VKVYTVYRYDYNRQVREPIGMVLERRKGDRGNDIKGLLKLAQKLYSRSSPDSHIVISPVLGEGSPSWAGPKTPPFLFPQS